MSDPLGDEEELLLLRDGRALDLYAWERGEGPPHAMALMVLFEEMEDCSCTGRCDSVENGAQVDG